MIDVIHVLAFHIMRKQNLFALMISDTSSIWTTIRYEMVKSEASKCIAILSWIRILPSKWELLPTTLNKIDWCDPCLRFEIIRKQVFRIDNLRYNFCLNNFPEWKG